MTECVTAKLQTAIQHQRSTQKRSIVLSTLPKHLSGESGMGRKRMQGEIPGTLPTTHLPVQHSVLAAQAIDSHSRKRKRPVTSSETNNVGSSAPQHRIDEKPVQFTHGSLAAERQFPWLSPGHPQFHACLKQSYRGLRIERSQTLPADLHRSYRAVFDTLHEAGLFMYDVVQAGGKKLSSTFVTRTLCGEAGITYKYLSLRIFAHPWDGGGGPDCTAFAGPRGDSSGSTSEDAAVSELWGSGPCPCASVRVSDALQQLQTINALLQSRADVALQAEGVTARLAATGHAPGSTGFNLSLINRMEPAGVGQGRMKNLKPEPLFGMGKASVSWHADSCLEDFSTIGVYHVTSPVVGTNGKHGYQSASTSKVPWSIAVRCSKEQTPGTNQSDIAVDTTATDVLTPPLVIPLQSGDCYFMLDDFNHHHEHLVLAGEDSLRYSSTHRVSVKAGNTFFCIEAQCQKALAAACLSSHKQKHQGQTTAAKITVDINLPQLRAQQAALTEVEGEWLWQFWSQGSTHARLHPWWRNPMNTLVGYWRALERETHAAVQHLLNLNTQVGDTLKAIDTLARALEERRQMRAKWTDRLNDSAYRSLPPEARPVKPALWDANDNSVLPFDLTATIAQLRQRYAAAYNTGTVAGSAKAIAAGATSNWAAMQQRKLAPVASNAPHTNASISANDTSSKTHTGKSSAKSLSNSGSGSKLIPGKQSVPHKHYKKKRKLGKG